MSLQDDVVLIIDDDPIQLEILADDLATIGVGRILTATSGGKGLEILKDNPGVTALLMDIMMPDMDGPQLLRMLGEARTSARIVLVSGVEADVMRSIGMLGRAHGLNVIGFIHKPVRRDVLRNLLATDAGRANVAHAKTSEHDTPTIALQQLIEALQSQAIHPWYQPKVDISQLRVVGVEALARWRRPDNSLVSPGLFVPVMETAGLASPLFFCMLEQVLADMARWRLGGMDIKVSVNLSMDCAYGLDLPEKIGALLQKYGVPARLLVIEVTESRLMANPAAAMETLTRLSLMGLVLSIDDFGTGYSGLAQVAQLPFGELKLDGSFVQQAGKSSKAHTILASTVTLGRSLGLDVVAEGVETHEQLDVLREMGASVIQGFLIAKPMPVESFEAWLASWRPGTASRPGCQRPLTFLVVDDDHSMRAYLAAELMDRVPAARVITAANGEEALALANPDIDGATLDFYMPGINGIELLRQMRNRCPATRYVLVTSNTHGETAQEATRLGAFYCPKPLTAPQMDRIVRRFTNW